MDFFLLWRHHFSMSKRIPYLYVLCAAVLWGSSAAVGKMLLADIANLQLLFYLCVFAFFSLSALVFAQKKTAILRSYSAKDYFTFAWMGLLGTFLYNFFFYGAVALMPAQEAFTINYLWPVMIVIFAVPVLHEKLTWKKILGILCSFVGVAVVVSKGDFSTFDFSAPLGILSATMGAVSYGLFSVIAKKQDYDKTVSIMLYYFFSAIYALIAVLLFSFIPALTFIQLLGLLYLGVFVQGIGFLFWFLALKYGDTAKMSNIIFITPFISLVFTYFLLGESILISSLVGLAIIVAGILAQSA